MVSVLVRSAVGDRAPKASEAPSDVKKTLRVEERSA